MSLRLITKYTGGTLPGAEEYAELNELAAAAHNTLENGTGAGSGMRGWLRFASRYPDSGEYKQLLAAAERIRSQADALVVVGIGGSYLGARAVLEAVASRYYNEIRRGTPAIYFTGNTLSESDYAELDALLGDRDFAVNVISKSGTTLEPAVAFRYFKSRLIAKYGDAEANRRIYVTTGASPASSTLYQQALAKGWQCFAVPEDMGGRYSVLSAVGLLPIACAGIDVDALLRGAADAAAAYAAPGARLPDNACYHYAALRYHYYKTKGKAVELFASYEPSLTLFGEWYKQLFGESEGKEGEGLFPASVTFTTDLHSLGQYIQEGRRLLFETVLTFGGPANALAVGEEPGNGDRLNYLAGKTLYQVNRAAFQATAMAHESGGCHNLVLELPKRDAYHIGWLIYFFEKACAISGYMLGVNPFDQPGVESYKTNMFTMLGHPDYI